MMKDRFPVRAALVLTLGLAPLAASAQTGDFVNGLVTNPAATGYLLRQTWNR